MRAADYVADWIANCTSGRVYAVCGGNAMHLNDAICNHPRIKVTAMHHEQAAMFAAECDYRVTGQVSVVHVTAGPGATNTLTGLACAHVDSCAVIVIAGAVSSNAMLKPGDHLRQRGMNEVPMLGMVQDVTKYAATVKNPYDLRDCLSVAVQVATTGRPGPVFIEIPLDVSAADINCPPPSAPTPRRAGSVPDSDIVEVILELRRAKRPVCMIGNGVRIAGGCDVLLSLLNAMEIPVLSSWSAHDIVPSGHHCHIGRPGLLGDRAGNFAMQNADLVLAIGTRLSVPQIGHRPEMFAPHAKKIIVDIDRFELRKPYPCITIPADARDFIMALHCALPERMKWPQWFARCKAWKACYPVLENSHCAQQVGVNSYYAVDEIASAMPNDAIVVTDVGASFISPMQMMKMHGQRLIHSCGVSPMGWAIPAAVGAAIATDCKRQIVCLTGDGGAMFNIQELQTIRHHGLPIAIFVFANDGYMTMRTTQRNHFKRLAVSDAATGVTCPNFKDVGTAFGIISYEENTNELFAWRLEQMFGRRPRLLQIDMAVDQPLLPRVQSRIEDGKFVPTDMADMYPYLPRDEFAAQMQTDDAAEPVA